MPDALTALWSKVKQVDDCLLWTGTVRKDGYAVVWHDGRLHRAHRLMWETENGPIPDGFHLHHKEECTNKACVALEHLELLTKSEHHKLHRRRQETCKRGHYFEPDNYFVDSKGFWHCCTCRRDAQNERRRRARRSRASV